MIRLRLPDKRFRERFRQSYRERFHVVNFCQKPAKTPRAARKAGSDLLAYSANILQPQPEAQP